ncbi:sulfur carrier protein ThiS [Hoeflea poritis]|uniref:Sulfur carrier protein ThiS n=1 Tax=Hoeflea poritis TaxID=2993659 RepID=A0ABT4VHR1_9HYPH|nr:sulfur carrier protein ThiS [Hoeflea poritis]MDA4844243.1 sulfur carrier protein ThiS [Hoeflea poritis]
MSLIVNGQPANVASRDLATLLTELSYDGDWLATAVNGVVIRRDDRVAYALRPGDRVEILSPMQGG